MNVKIHYIIREDTVGLCGFPDCTYSSTAPTLPQVARQELGLIYSRNCIEVAEQICWITIRAHPRLQRGMRAKRMLPSLGSPRPPLFCSADRQMENLSWGQAHQKTLGNVRATETEALHGSSRKS